LAVIRRALGCSQIGQGSLFSLGFVLEKALGESLQITDVSIDDVSVTEIDKFDFVFTLAN
jgi:hypothetical protein